MMQQESRRPEFKSSLLDHQKFLIIKNVESSSFEQLFQLPKIKIYNLYFNLYSC